MKRRTLLLALMVWVSQQAISQNARFSQIFSAPIQFNPALTGRFDGKVRLSGLVSLQETDVAKMQHQNISLDAKFGRFRSHGDDPSATATSDKKGSKEGKDEIFKSRRSLGYWGGGLNYYHYGHPDGPLSATFLSASLARHFYNRSNKFFGFGVQATYAKGTLDETRGLAYDREISGGTFPYPRRTPNNYKSDKDYIDYNVGAYYGMVTDAVMFELGGSMAHLFYPKNDIYGRDQETELRHRITAHSVLRLRLNNKWGIVQKNVYWQEGLYYRSTSLTPKDSTDREIVAFWSGIDFYRVNPAKNINVNFGFYTRSFRTLMPVLNINLGKIANLRYSYELPINSSKFKAYTAKRHEAALIFTYKRNTSPGTNFYKKINFW